MVNLHRLMAGARAQGRDVTRVVRQAVYGTRAPWGVSASVPIDNQSANGVGPRSVWQGPAISATSGAPILRRNRSA